MSKFFLNLKRVILVAGDIAVFYFSLWLTLVIRYGLAGVKEHWSHHFLPFTILFVGWLVIFYIAGIYGLQGARNKFDFFSALFKGLVWCAGLAVAFFYLIKPGIAPKTNLLMEFIFLIMLIILWRQFFNRLLNINALRSNVLIVGLNEASINLAQEIKDKPQLGFRLMGIVADNVWDEKEKEAPAGIEIIPPPHSLAGLVQIKKIKIIITAANYYTNVEMVKNLYECLPLKISFWDIPTFVEKFTGKIPVNAIGQIWFLENLKESEKDLYEGVKRVLDILLSFILLILSIPFLPLLYLIVKLDSQGPFFFMQQRVGRRGKRFMAIKIRTMYKNSEINGPQWAQKNDPRVTRNGRVMRKLRIDEIPQLVNILRGEMSFIGPRPERPEFIEKLEKKIPYYNERLMVKPGLTGWAQINFPYGASEEDALEKLQYDLYYIKNRSFILDISIVLKTIKTVLGGGGQ